MKLVVIVFVVEESKSTKKEEPQKPRVFTTKEKAILESKTLEDLDLYVRTKTVFRNVGITTLPELLSYSEKDLRKFRYIGNRAIENINEELSILGLELRK